MNVNVSRDLVNETNCIHKTAILIDRVIVHTRMLLRLLLYIILSGDDDGYLRVPRGVLPVHHL